jgi:hypothetical protein
MRSPVYNKPSRTCEKMLKRLRHKTGTIIVLVCIHGDVRPAGAILPTLDHNLPGVD